MLDPPLVVGDVVNHWILVVKDGAGDQLTDLRWTAVQGSVQKKKLVVFVSYSLDLRLIIQSVKIFLFSHNNDDNGRTDNDNDNQSNVVHHPT